MTTVIYADVMIIINFCIDFVCLYIVDIILHRKTKLLRLILASILGALYSVVGTVFDFFFLHILIMLLICYVSFGGGISVCLKSSSIFYFLSLLLGGIGTIIYQRLGENGMVIALFPLSVVISLLLFKLFFNEKEKLTINIVFESEKETYNSVAFVDNGNLLCDPITQKSVVLVKKKFLGENFEITNEKGFRIIPTDYKGLVIIKCFVPKTFYIEYGKRKIEKNVLIALDETDGDFDGFDVLIPGKVVREL